MVLFDSRVGVVAAEVAGDICEKVVIENSGDADEQLGVDCLSIEDVVDVGTTAVELGRKPPYGV